LCCEVLKSLDCAKAENLKGCSASIAKQHDGNMLTAWNVINNINCYKNGELDKGSAMSILDNLGLLEAADLSLLERIDLEKIFSLLYAVQCVKINKLFVFDSAIIVNDYM